MDLEIKEFAIEELKADEESRTIEGYASVFDYTDSHRDVVEHGAFAKSLRKNKPAMLWQHRSDSPIGVWKEMEEDDKGLRVKGTLLDTTLGNDVYKMVKAKAIKGMSIGYFTKKDE